MKNKLTLSLVGLLAILSLGFFSCKKDTVVNNVNNASSENLVINPSRWQLVNSNGNRSYVASYTIDDTKLPVDDFLFGTDAVFLYASFAQNGEEYPFMGDGTQFGDYYISYGVVAANNGAGVVTITAVPIGNAGAPTDPLYVHAVYMQPNKTGNTPTVLSNVNMKDYNAVKAALNLK